jgi:hypothetical protein
MVVLRSGKAVAYQAVKTKGFNVTSRAVQPDVQNILISDEAEIQRLATSYNLKVMKPEFGHPATIDHAAYYFERLKELFPPQNAATTPKEQNKDTDEKIPEGKLKRSRSKELVDERTTSRPRMDELAQVYVLVSYGREYLYFSRTPLLIRGPRPNAAAPKKTSRKFNVDPEVDVFVIPDEPAEWDSPCTKGADQPDRNTVMGCTAKNYAKEVVDDSFAEERNWEWLHIIGHSIGGDNEVNNLFAGTFDANTGMIPLESQIQQFAKSLLPGQKVYAQWTVEVYPGTKVATYITMSFGLNKAAWSHQGTFRAATDLCFDKFCYDVWNLVNPVGQ